MDKTNKTALITGITGQDGSLLAQYLISRGYKIIAPVRKNFNQSRLQVLGLLHSPAITYLVYQRWCDFKKIVQQNIIHEFYHLAAMSHVGKSYSEETNVLDVNSLWTTEILGFLECDSPQTRFFFASSCEIFSADNQQAIDESACTNPSNPYGISKLTATNMVRYFREVKGLFASSAILFNHESELRDDSFVSKKITKTVAKIVKGLPVVLSLGNIESQKDWSYAPDFVTYFHKILQQKYAADFILASGKRHSVKDMVNCAFSALKYPITWHGSGLDCVAKNKQGKIVVQINPAYFRPLDNRFLIGDTRKAQQQLGFGKLTSFSDWVTKMTLFEWNKLA